MQEPCSWPISYAACGATPAPPGGFGEAPFGSAPFGVQAEDLTGCDALDDLPPEQRALFERMAVELLWRWTGRVFGVCQDTVRPCRSDCEGAARWASTFWGNGPYPWTATMGAGSWVPFLIGGKWYNVGCGCAGNCSCSIDGPTSLRLPGPVISVDSVRIDGEVLDPSAYYVAYGRNLVRRDGGVWPSCQNLLAPATEVGTFEVVYSHGIEVPEGGRVAAGFLACELAKAACGDATCQLPERIQTVTRQGVTIGFSDDFSALEDGRTGIWLVDSWTSSVKASKRTFAGVRSPDYKPRRRPV